MKRKKRFASINGNACAACGECGFVCPMDAITINGVMAIVDETKCVGCGLCMKSCPAGCIEIKVTEVDK